MTAAWINKLTASDSRLHKEAVLTTALYAANSGDIGAQIFLGLCKACYNPFVVFGVRKVPDTVGIIDADNPWNDFNSLLTQLSQRDLTGNAALDAINEMSERFDSAEWNTFCAPVIRRDLRAGISSTTINKICKKTQYEIPVFGCQLATNCEDRPEMKGRKRLEPKIDGARCLIVVQPMDNGEISTTCFSRNGKQYDNFGHIEDQIRDNYTEIVKAFSTVSEGKNLARGFVLDGEVMSNSFQELMRQARRKTDVHATDSVFNIFDVVALDAFHEGKWNVPLSTRVSLLDSLLPVVATINSLELLPSIMVDLDTQKGKDKFNKYCADAVNDGFEGAMIKDMDSVYDCKRTTAWMKYKPVYDYDLTVIGIEEGTGRNAGRMGALVCEGIDGGKHITVNVGSGYSDEERQSYWNNKNSVIGQTAVVLADAITQNQDGSYSLRFPRFKTFRTDK